MGLQWMEGWDHYGDDEALLLDGVYAENNSGTLSTANPRTGTHQLRVTAANDAGVRRVFSDDLTEVGVGYAFYIPTLPGDSESLYFAEFRDINNNGQCGIRCTSDGRVQAYRGHPDEGSFAILDASGIIVPAGSYTHIEVFVRLDDTDGAIEVRMNSVTILNLTGIDTQAEAGTFISQVQIGASGNAISAFPAYFDVDDLFAWDVSSGSLNNDFIGDKKVYTLMPNADTATEDWTPATGSDSYAMVDDIPPDDGTHYLTTLVDGDVTRLAYENLPADVVAVSGVQVYHRTWKTDAGDTHVAASIVQGADLAPGVDRPVTLVPTYYGECFEVDPTSGVMFTPSDINSLQVEIERLATSGT